MSIQSLKQPLLSAQEKMKDSPNLQTINGVEGIGELYTQFLNWKDLSVYAPVDHQTRKLVDTETERSLVDRNVKIVETVQGHTRDTTVQFSKLAPGQKRAIVHGEEAVINHYGPATTTIACCIASVKNCCECLTQCFNKEKPNYVTVSEVITEKLTTHFEIARPTAPPQREQMEG